MINFLKEWITNIVVLIIFLSLVELILPDNSMRKYVRFVIGIIVIINILVPVFKLFDRRFSLEESISTYEKKYESYFENKNSLDMQSKMQEATINEFKNNLKQNIEKDILKNTGKKVLVVRLEVNEKFGADDFGKIKYIEVKKEQSSEIQPVEKIIIGSNNSNTVHVNKDKEILNYISKTYGISEENIAFVK
ncbi:stage III sporulation protein AF [Thermobrachium celere]|uniref:Stage III sporulation protein AF n=1 Tax=Thermobrachium celere DSM 8682 TaxID=941824 RepID=R7RSE9_9CLOT|nr:stage III sporulation protein AF [Thermobrachium celere]GFR34262.1 stage III sporulation protein AF [Thermobrachium celere]CDF58213.1 Stage III sporulation protein AF [Thermobrachium celere DSM 8682]